MEAALSERPPLGTYVRRTGPTGTIGEHRRSQSHIDRLTLLTSDTFEADVTIERRESSTREKSFVRGAYSLRPGARGGEFVFDPVGLEVYSLERVGDRLTVVTQWEGRRTELERVETLDPRDSPTLRLDCAHAASNASARDTIDVVVVGEGHLRGTADVHNESGSRSWPRSQSYELTVSRAAPEGVRALASPPREEHSLELRFSKVDLENPGEQAFEAHGSFKNEGPYSPMRMFKLACRRKR